MSLVYQIDAEASGIVQELLFCFCPDFPLPKSVQLFLCALAWEVLSIRAKRWALGAVGSVLPFPQPSK